MNIWETSQSITKGFSAFVRSISIEKRYKELGEVHYRQKVEKILVETNTICAEPPDETNWEVNVFLGVNRDLSNEPSALIILHDKPAQSLLVEEPAGRRSDQCMPERTGYGNIRGCH